MYYVKFFDKNGYNPCGSDGSVFIRDLKTLRGVVNRVQKNYFRAAWYDSFSVYILSNPFSPEGNPVYSSKFIN